VYHTDSGNYAMAHGRGLDPRSHRVLEHGSQQQRGQAYYQRRGDRYEPPPSPAGSKRKHPRKDATAGSRIRTPESSRSRDAPLETSRLTLNVDHPMGAVHISRKN
jgi:hypothetical protein